MPGKIVRKSAPKKKVLKPKTKKQKITKKVVPLPDTEEISDNEEEISFEEELVEEESAAENAADIDEEPESSDPKEKKRAPRKKPTMESFLAKFDSLIEITDQEITKRSKTVSDGGRGGKDVRFLKTIRKNLRELKKQAPRVIVTKRGVVRDGNKVSGFVLPCEISDELADFIGVKHGATPSRREITNAICAYIKLEPDEKREHMLKWEHLNKGRKRNLQKKENKMAIDPDKPLARLLRYDEYCQNVIEGKITINKSNKKSGKTKKKVVVTDNTLRYYVLQKLLKPHIKTLSKKN